MNFSVQVTKHSANFFYRVYSTYIQESVSIALAKLGYEA